MKWSQKVMKLLMEVAAWQYSGESILRENLPCTNLWFSSAPNYCDTIGNLGALINMTGKDLTPKFVTFAAVVSVTGDDELSAEKLCWEFGIRILSSVSIQNSCRYSKKHLTLVTGVGISKEPYIIEIHFFFPRTSGSFIASSRTVVDLTTQVNRNWRRYVIRFTL